MLSLYTLAARCFSLGNTSPELALLIRTPTDLVHGFAVLPLIWDVQGPVFLRVFSSDAILSTLFDRRMHLQFLPCVDDTARLALPAGDA